RKFCHKNIPLSSDQRNSPSRHYLNNCLSLTYSAQYCAQLITVDNLPFDTEYLGLNVISGSHPQPTEQSLVTPSVLLIYHLDDDYIDKQSIHCYSNPISGKNRVYRPSP